MIVTLISTTLHMTEEPTREPLSPEEPEPGPAELSESGHWAETQVIESIKEANFRHKDPRRLLKGQTTQPLGGIFHPVAPSEGKLVTPKPSRRSRLRRWLRFLSS